MAFVSRPKTAYSSAVTNAVLDNGFRFGDSQQPRSSHATPRVATQYRRFSEISGSRYPPVTPIDMSVISIQIDRASTVAVQVSTLLPAGADPRDHTGLID